MSKTTKAISTVTILLLISRLFGFVREMIIAAYYGATTQTDAYNMAILIVGLSTTIISATVTTVIIPMYNHKRIQKSQAEADLFINNLLWITSLFYLFISVLGIIYAPVLVGIFAPNFDKNTAALTTQIIKMTFIFTIAVNISNFMTSVSQIHDKFSVTVISIFPLNIFTILAIIFFIDKIGIYALVAGYILFLITQVFILILSSHKIFTFKATFNFTNGDLKNVLKLSLPLYISIAVWEINMIIDKILASGLSEGSISAIIYASKLKALPDGILTAAVITVMFPLLSKYAAKKDFTNIKETARKTMSLLFLSLLPVIAVSLYYSKEIISIVYERGIFTPDMTLLTADIFTFSIISLVFSGCAAFLNNLFYSIQDTKSPQIAAIIMVAVNIVFNLLLIRYMQAAGLALATSIASFVYFIVLFIQFRLKFGSFGGLSLLKNILKCIISTAGMIPVFLLCEIFRDRLPLLIFFTVSAFICFFVYALLLYLFKVELFMEAWARIKAFMLNIFMKKEMKLK
jgi:putative peptidoglycan lipid II flippase